MKSVSQQRRKGKGRRRKKGRITEKSKRENDAMITLLVCRRRRLEEDTKRETF
jgi:hypothetical protein